jgi:Arm DNA-binding domain
MAFGEYPLVSLAQARERLLAGRKMLAAGVDPMAERKAEAEAKQREAEAREREAENSFERVARKWWEWWAAGKSPRAMPITSCGAWKQTFSRRLATGSLTL